MGQGSLGAAFAAARQLLCQSRSIVLTTHIHPDGDGIGSALALWHYLRQQGKDVRIILHSSVPAPLRFLPGAEEIEQWKVAEHKAIVGTADVIVVVDTSELSRLGALAQSVANSPARKVVIDHHLSPQPFADVYVIDPTACATGELVWRFLRFLGGPYRQREIGIALYTAIMTDTGSFAYSNTSAAAHRTVAELVELGVDIPTVHDHVFHSWSLARMRLLGEVLAGMELYHGGRVCLLVVPREAFLRTGAVEEDIEGFAQYTLSVEGVQIGLLVVELPMEGGIKVSFRSRAGISVHELAAEFGGGGHEHAAGARISNGELPEVCQRLVERAAAYLRP
ncbi:MAG: DHH family phosphoesterase [Candidatus Kapabacteria bacterium]|nr:DHH family phosphoesterase [Candidatus Kapabacteria bacterium]MDW8012095.1 DHH family phosphoesterase [Bacteroidota bacterium]